MYLPSLSLWRRPPCRPRPCRLLAERWRHPDSAWRPAPPRLSLLGSPSSVAAAVCKVKILLHTLYIYIYKYD